MKKIIAVILSLIMILPSFALMAEAAGMSDIPCVIIPGIGQSRAWLVDENGNYVLNSDGEKIHCFPGNFDIQKILGDVAGPLALSVASQSDMGLSDALCQALENAFYMNKTNDYGVPCGYVKVETYDHPLSECTDDELQYIFDCIPMQSLGESIGYENMYYYAYNSFGNALETIDDLYGFIQMVKKQTGKSKINIIPISMGGAIFNGLMELHPDVANDLHRIVFVVPALNGSLIVSDIYQRELTFLDADYLYSDFFDGILSESDASTIEIAIRVLPRDVLMTSLNKAVDMLIEKVLGNCTALWMLVPNDQYDKCVEKTLSDSSKAEIRRQTDIYHNAQSNSNKNILKFRSKGVEIFDVIGYDVPLYNVGNSWNQQNADGVIHTYSTSIGATMANVGQTLPDGYVQKNTYCTVTANAGLVDRLILNAASSSEAQCSDPKHNHISPDRVVDASTGLLPDHTFYFDNQPHATANQNDIIMKLCCELVETDRIKDVYSDANYPQFNVGRATKVLREELLPAAAGVDKSKLSKEDRQELEQAVNDANAMLSRTIAVEGEAPAVEQRLRAALEKVGAVEANSGPDISPTVKAISDTLLAVGGAQGYSDMLKGLVSNPTASNGDGGSSGSTDDSNTAQSNTVDNTANGSSASSGGSSQTGGNASSSSSGNTSGSTTATNAKNPKTSGYSVNYLPVYACAAIALAVLATVTGIIIKRKREEF